MHHAFLCKSYLSFSFAGALCGDQQLGLRLLYCHPSRSASFFSLGDGSERKGPERAKIFVNQTPLLSPCRCPLWRPTTWTTPSPFSSVSVGLLLLFGYRLRKRVAASLVSFVLLSPLLFLCRCLSSTVSERESPHRSYHSFFSVLCVSFADAFRGDAHSDLRVYRLVRHLRSASSVHVPSRKGGTPNRGLPSPAHRARVAVALATSLLIKPFFAEESCTRRLPRTSRR